MNGKSMHYQDSLFSFIERDCDCISLAVPVFTHRCREQMAVMISIARRRSITSKVITESLVLGDWHSARAVSGPKNAAKNGSEEGLRFPHPSRRKRRIYLYRDAILHRPRWRTVMKTAAKKALFGSVSVALLLASAATFAQGGGNGQGGTGGGNAHGAATAGMTHWGDPVSGPYAPHPGDMASSRSTNGLDSTSMQASRSQAPMKSGQ
jgi:hypothetical protein